MMAGMDDNTSDVQRWAEKRAIRARCEPIIERHLQSFCEFSMALLEVRDTRAYEPDYATFSDYCKSRWGWGIKHTYRMIRSATVVYNLSPVGDEYVMPQNENQVRALSRLEPEQQREAWQKAVEFVEPASPTYEQVEDIVRTQFENRLTLFQEETERRARAESERLIREAEERTREAEERAEQSARDRRQAERDSGAAKERIEELLQERDEIRIRRLAVYGKLIDAVNLIADFHFDSASDAWDGISGAKGGDSFVEAIDKAQRLLSRLKSEHPNAVRKPGIVLQKPG